jgi:hypothetical protein
MGGRLACARYCSGKVECDLNHALSEAKGQAVLCKIIVDRRRAAPSAKKSITDAK